MDETFCVEFAEAKATVDKIIRCPDVAAIAIVLVWLSWSRRPDVALQAHINFGVRQARTGRDLTGVQESKFRDAFRRMQQGAGMDEKIDPSPGPDRLVEDAEAYPLWEDSLTDKESQAADLYLEGRRNLEVAEALNVSQGRTSQLRAQMAEKWDRLSE